MVPSQEELRKVLYSDKTPLRTRASIALIAFSGLRFQSQGDYARSDGLRVGDLPELQIDDGRAAFSKKPAQVIVRANLNKARHKYVSFLNEEGCRIIEELLNRRVENGEKIDKATPIVATTTFYDPRGRKGTKVPKGSVRHLSSIKIGDAIREAIRANGFSWRPYVFRSYFDTALMLAESKGRISHSYQQFWMGHKGDIEATYTTNKSRLSDDVIEDMRGAYLKCEQFLSTEKAEAGGEEKIKRAFKEQLLLIAGFKKEKVEKMDFDSMTDEDFQQMIRQKLLGAMANNGSRQKVISLAEVENHVSQGWEFVAALPNDRAILRVPF